MIRLLIIFLILCVASLISINVFNVQLSNLDYWDHHGAILLIFLTFFPRLALLFSSIPFGGVLYWLGFIFCPHYLVAILATINYWPENPVLVTVAWFVALGGEAFEKFFITKTVRKSSRIIDMN